MPQRHTKLTALSQQQEQKIRCSRCDKVQGICSVNQPSVDQYHVLYVCTYKFIYLYMNTHANSFVYKCDYL